MSRFTVLSLPRETLPGERLRGAESDQGATAGVPQSEPEPRPNDVVVDPESGQRRAVLEIGELSPSLRLFNEEDRAVVELGVTPNGPTLTFVNRRSQQEDLFNPRR